MFVQVVQRRRGVDLKICKTVCQKVNGQEKTTLILKKVSARYHARLEYRAKAKRQSTCKKRYEDWTGVLEEP
jgi:hypothetical protein